MSIIAKYKFNQNTYENFIPEFNSGFKNYTITDEIDTDGYTVRTIESNNLPTLMQFGNNVANNKTKSLLSILKCNTENITSMRYMFSRCEKLTSIDLSSFNTSRVTDMYFMFNGCSSLTSLDLSNFNTSKVTDMGHMFYGCSKLTSLDLYSFDTSKVTDSSHMFDFITSSTTIYLNPKTWNIDVSSYSAKFIRVARYKYTIAKYTFNNTAGDCLPTITGATTSQWGYSDKVDGNITTRTIGTDEELTITNISFRGKTSLLTLDYLNFTNAITNATRMFEGCTALTSINALNWVTSAVSNMSYMFRYCSKLISLDLSSFNVEKVTTTAAMFTNCGSLTTLNLSNWNASKLSNMVGMFQSCSALATLDASSWKVDIVTDMSNVFNGCGSLTTLDLSNWNTSKVSNMSNMFNGCSALTSLNTSNWNTSKVTNMSNMFQNCAKLTTLDLSHFNVENVTSMYSMFNSCRELTSLNTSNWNTSKVTNMGNMFQNCVKLTTLDLSHFNVENVTSISAMFISCSSLATVDLSSWNTSKVTNMLNMFYDCNKLVSLDLSNFDTSKVTTWGSLRGINKLTDIGLVYASSSTINSIVTNWLGTSVARNVYYMDAEPSELTTRANITYVPYSQSILSCSEEITLRSNGDVYDELDLLTGQVIQRIGEDNEILEEEIIRTVELDGEISFHENSYIHTSSNEITPEFEFQPTLTNCYVVSDLKPNTQYTVLFEGNPTLMSLGGTTIENPISKIMITSGEVDNILWFDAPVSKIMILEGDLTNRDIEYFTGVKSSQKIEVQLRGNTPYFAKGGRK